MLKEQVGQGSGAEAGFESVDMIVWNNTRLWEQPLLCDGDGEDRSAEVIIKFCIK